MSTATSLEPSSATTKFKPTITSTASQTLQEASGASSSILLAVVSSMKIWLAENDRVISEKTQPKHQVRAGTKKEQPYKSIFEEIELIKKLQSFHISDNYLFK